MQDTKEESLRRLAILEKGPIRNPAEWSEWNNLRRWVINEDLIEEFRIEADIVKAGEVTKVGIINCRPKNYWSRLLSLISK
jgi:hypothetical protein